MKCSCQTNLAASSSAPAFQPPLAQGLGLAESCAVLRRWLSPPTGGNAWKNSHAISASNSKSSSRSSQELPEVLKLNSSAQLSMIVISTSISRHKQTIHYRLFILHTSLRLQLLSIPLSLEPTGLHRPERLPEDGVVLKSQQRIGRTELGDLHRC